jgi:uncharacterized membrane protein YhaH (DUF805 family)
MRTSHPVARAFIAALIAFGGYYYFAAVLPANGAIIVAVALAILELAAPLFSGNTGVGGSLRLVIRIAGALLLWPAIAIALEHWGGIERGAAIAFASMIACVFGIGASGLGSGRDRTRIATIIVSICLPFYALVAAAFDPSPVAWTVAAIGVAIAALIAEVSGVWPSKVESTLLTAAGLAGVAGAASLLRWLV